MGKASIPHATSEPAATPDADYDAIVARLRDEFLDYAGDALDELDGLIESGRNPDSRPFDTIDAIRRSGHNLKGMGGSFGFPLITLLAHRMEDYFMDRESLGQRTLEDAQCFVDRMRETLEGKFDGVSEANVVRTLPAKTGFEVADVVKQDVEVLLVMPRGAMSRIIEQEFQACGYRVVTVTRPFAAIETAVRTNPDLIVASAVMEDLSGIDLACALHAMPISRDMPFMLLTSLSREDGVFADLPAKVPLVRKGDLFPDDLAEALASLGIT
jgi:CheY-like chemotaxis protein